MATYRKTAKGLAEIATRANKLPPRLRTALILVDGRRTDDELSSMLPKEADETLRWLSDSGFIEVDHSTANASQSSDDRARPGRVRDPPPRVMRHPPCASRSSRFSATPCAS